MYSRTLNFYIYIDSVTGVTLRRICNVRAYFLTRCNTGATTSGMLLELPLKSSIKSFLNQNIVGKTNFGKRAEILGKDKSLLKFQNFDKFTFSPGSPITAKELLVLTVTKVSTIIMLLSFAATGKASNIGSLDGGFTIGEPKLSRLITAAAVKYKLERRLLSCLYFVESTYRLDIVSRTNDHGIGQINERTALGFKMSVPRLTSDLAYSVDRSAYMLSHYKQLKQAEEPRTWICRYNVGPGPLTKKGRGGACEAYLERINRCRVSDLAVL